MKSISGKEMVGLLKRPLIAVEGMGAFRTAEAAHRLLKWLQKQM